MPADLVGDGIKANLDPVYLKLTFYTSCATSQGYVCVFRAGVAVGRLLQFCSRFADQQTVANYLYQPEGRGLAVIVYVFLLPVNVDPQ